MSDGKEPSVTRRQRILKMLLVEPGTPAGLAERDPRLERG
jgi:hypothetical protein